MMHKWLGSPAPLRCRALVVILSLGTSRHLVARHFSSSCRSALLVVLSLGTSRRLVARHFSSSCRGPGSDQHLPQRSTTALHYGTSWLRPTCRAFLRLVMRLPSQYHCPDSDRRESFILLLSICDSRTLIGSEG